MAERKVIGSDQLFFIDPAGGTTYSLVVCLTSQSFSIVNNLIDAKSKCGADKLPGTQEFSAAFEGQVIMEAGTLRVGAFDLITLCLNKTTIGWKMGPASPVTGDVIKSGTAFLSKYDETAGQDDPATFSCELGIYGTPTVTEFA